MDVNEQTFRFDILTNEEKNYTYNLLTQMTYPFEMERQLLSNIPCLEKLLNDPKFDVDAHNTPEFWQHKTALMTALSRVDFYPHTQIIIRHILNKGPDLSMEIDTKRCYEIDEDGNEIKHRRHCNRIPNEGELAVVYTPIKMAAEIKDKDFRLEVLMRMLEITQGKRMDYIQGLVAFASIAHGVGIPSELVSCVASVAPYVLQIEELNGYLLSLRMSRPMDDFVFLEA